MKNQITKLVLISFAFFCFFNSAYADTTIHLKIETDTGSIYDKDIDVKPCDSEGTGTMETTAYCALSQSEIASDWSGLWTNSINGIANNDNNNGAYWMWLANLNTNNPYSDFNCHQDAPYGCSAKQYILNPNDNILFYYNIDPLAPPITPDTSSAPVGTGGGQLPSPVITESTPVASAVVPDPIPPAKPTFDIKKAFDFLIAQQKDDGSFGENLYTDWTAIALARGNYQEQILKLIKYFEESKTENYSLTDYERRAMALMSLGLNPYDTNGENYIKKITDSFDGKQFGDTNEDNDDIFALIVLQNAGYSQNDKMISDDISFILSLQNENGSWDNSVDMTGATLEALASLNKIQPLPALPLSGEEKIPNALAKAENFLKQNQKDDGSWNNNASSTAWAMEGILALNEKPEDWIKNNNTPLDYLALNQDTDGSIKNENINNKIWETAYVVSALSGKTWNQIMQKFAPTSQSKTLRIGVPTSLSKSVGKKDTIQKSKNMLSQTATVVNSITPPATNETTTITETPKRNWFMRFLGNVFGF